MKQIQGVRVVLSKLLFRSGAPHAKNYSQYSGSANHTFMIVETPIPRTASKVRFIKYNNGIESLHVAMYGTKCSLNSEELWVWL